VTAAETGVEEVPSGLAEVKARGPWRQALDRFRRRPLGMAALTVFLVFFVVGALATVLAPYYPGQEFIELIDKPKPPLASHHFLGTDVLGHDFLTQILFAIHETTISALLCAGGATLIGVAVGATAGYFGGWFDTLVTAVTAVVVAIPAIAVLIVVSVWARVPESPLSFGLWLMALLWTVVARVVRSSVASLRTKEFVEAAEAAGASAPRILTRHVLPNSLGVVMVAATSIVGQSIAIVATVDYLGYGYNRPDRPTLGGLLADATKSSDLLRAGNGPLSSLWWLYVLPAVLLVGLLLSVNFLGDALDDALNPSAG